MRSSPSFRLSQWLALGWLATLLLLGGLSLFWPQPEADLLQISQPPSGQHWLGTDPFGRDLLADLVAGTRSLLSISIPAAMLTSLIGTLLGGAAGYWGNQHLRLRRAAAFAFVFCLLASLITGPGYLPWWLMAAVVGMTAAYQIPLFRSSFALPLDQSVQLAATFLGAVPRLLLVLLLVAVRPASPAWLLALLALTCWTATARLMRAQVSQLREQLFVEAAQVAGTPAWRVLGRHIFPNAWPSLRASLPLNLGACISLQTTLSFLGVGLPPDHSDWGRTLANARLEPTAWWLILGGALPLAATAIALHLILPTSGAIPMSQKKAFSSNGKA